MAGNVLGSLLLNIVTKSDDSGLRKTDRSLRKIGTTARTVAKNASLLGSLSRKLMGGFSIATLKGWFDSYLQFEKDLGAMQSRFYAVTHSEKESIEEFDYIRKLATDTALDVKKTADSYSIFYSATRQALGKEGARGVYEAWAQVGRVLHLSDYQMERVTYALREMASKGAIYSQDLRMQIGTHVPNAMGLAQKAAEEMGYTGVDWFTKLQDAAKGNTKVTADFVQKFSKQAQLMYASPDALKKAMQQPDALAKQIAMVDYNFMVEFSRKGGSYMIIKILQGISRVLLSIDYNFITSTLGNIAKILGDTSMFLSKNIDTIVMLLRIIAGIYGARRAGALLGTAGMKLSLLKLELRALGITTSKGLLKGLWGILAGMGVRGVIGRLVSFLGGPWGLAIGVIITFLPNIVSFCKKIWYTLTGKKEEANLSGFLQSHGINPDTFYNAFAKLNKDKGEYGGSITELRRQASGYLGKDVGGMFTYNENGDVVININGTILTPEEFKRDLENSSGTIEDIKKDKNKYFYKPVIGNVPAWEL